MGKQKKQRKRGKNTNNNLSKPNNNNSSKDEQETNKNSKNRTIIQKLRNTSNPEIIETTLSALCMTIFHPSTLQEGKLNSKSMSSDLLHAIVDKIVDNNGSSKKGTGIITNALGIVQNIVSFDNNNEIVKLLLDGNLDILRVLLVRISTSINIIKMDNIVATNTTSNDNDVVVMDIESSNTTAASTASTQKSKKKKHKKITRTGKIESTINSINHQWEILKASYLCLVTLMESLPTSITETKLTNSEYYKPCTLLQIIKDSTFLMQQQQERATSTKNDCIRYVTQMIHTSIDENMSFTMQLVENDNTILEFLNQVMMDNSCPDLARLHACGCILSLRQNLLYSSKHQTILHLLNNHCQHALPILLQSIQSFDARIINDYLKSLSTLQNSIDQEKEDEILENSTIKSIELKKESARSIAKRLHANKKDNTNKNKDDQKKDDNASNMIEDDKDSCMDIDTTTSTLHKMSLQEQYDDVYNNYKSNISKYELTLELCTNLCCTAPQDDDDEMMCDVTAQNNDPILKSAVDMKIPKTIITFFTLLGQIISSNQEEELLNRLLETCTTNIHNLQHMSQCNVMWNDWIGIVQQYKDTSNYVLLECVISILCRCQQCNITPQQEQFDLFISIFQKQTKEKIKIDLLIILGLYLTTDTTQQIITKMLQSIILPTLLSKKQTSKLSLEVMNVCMDLDDKYHDSTILEQMKYAWKEYRGNSNVFLDNCGCNGDEEKEYYKEIMENIDRFLDYKNVS